MLARLFGQSAIALSAALAVGLAGGAHAKEFYKLSTISLATPFTLNTTFAKIIQKYNPDIEIQVNATGAAPRHALDAARGKTDFFMGAPAVHDFMINGKAMFAKVESAKELAKNLRAIFNYRIGYYQFGVYADSGIKTFADLKGRRVFLGPPAAVQRLVAAGFIEAVSGLKEGKDYEAVKLDFSAAQQAFQDRQIEMLTAASNPPSSTFQQVALTSKLRFLGASSADWDKPATKKVMSIPGRTVGSIAPDAYGRNQVNEEPVQTIAAWVGLVTRKGIPDDVIYKMTKTFWEHVGEMHDAVPWAKDAINLDNAFQELNMPLHPGAIRYYKEIGLDIPKQAM